MTSSKEAAPGSRSRRRGRGRDLPARIAVGAALGALALGTLLTAKSSFAVLTVIAIVLAVWELTNALAVAAIRVPVVPVALGSGAMLLAAYVSGVEALAVALGLAVVVTALWRLGDGPEGFVRDVAGGLFVLCYVPLLAGFALLMLRAEDGPRRVIVFILVTVASDIGGYAVGSWLGRHPMAPNVSPKKSWEGLAGSVLACVAAGALAVPLLLDGRWWHGAILGLVLVAVATTGDLAESSLKRALGIKDMGSLLPGHGGLMDRLDSLLPSAPFAWVLLAWLVPA